ncbi:MAG: hypothetical protein WBP73_03670 [Terriglobales bacterium]
MKTSERPSKQVHVRDSLHQHLHTYALAASAAGVSILALAQPSEAEIVYTPADVYIGQNRPYLLDLTGDGTTDFYLVEHFLSTTTFIWSTLLVRPAQGNEIAEGAAALRAGYIISNADFSSKGYSGKMATCQGIISSHRAPKRHCFGPWKDKKNHYLGLQFMISGEVHYGWARLSVSCVGGEIENAELTGYAYETIPNKGIVAGKKKGELEDESLNGSDGPTPPSTPASTSATLGMLAKGAQALSIWRRD